MALSPKLDFNYMILLFINLLLGKGLTILVYAEEEQEKENAGFI